jgi:CRISPR system Cascade subunit CasD
MSTLLLRLEGPQQAWGSDSQFEKRMTGREPTKSGVIGLLCAALGKSRIEREGDEYPTLRELAALQMGVRVDAAGSLQADYHTAGNPYSDGTGGVLTASGKLRTDPVLSTRYYLAGASFLVGLGGELPLLQRLHAALRVPVWQICLGRKAFVPSAPVYLHDGLVEETLLVALGRYWPKDSGPEHGTVEGRRSPAPQQLNVLLDDPDGTSGDIRLDVPEDFAARRFGPRAVKSETVVRPQAAAQGG